MFDYFIINCMEKPVSEKKSFSIKIWLPILIGIFCIAASVLTFVGIYMSTPNYVLLKNDYDIYKNVDKKELTEEDINYSFLREDDKEFFNVQTNYFEIKLEKLYADNSSFQFSNYLVDVGFKISEVAPGKERSIYSLNYSIDDKTINSNEYRKTKGSSVVFEKIKFKSTASSLKFSFGNVNIDDVADKLDRLVIMFYGEK